MNYDRPLIAILLSIAGAIPVGIFLEIMKFFGLTRINALEATSMMFIPEGSLLLGILSHIGYSAVLGLILYYSPKLLGFDYFPLKAMFLSMVAESLLFIIFGTLIKNPSMIQNTSSNYTLASAAALGGLSRGYLIKRYLFNHYRVPN